MDGKVGILGLGLLGHAIAERLLDTSMLAAVWNRTTERAAAFPVELRAGSPEDVAARASILALVLADDRATESVLREQGLEAALKPHHLVLNFGTIGPRAAESIGARIAARGARYLDVPVLGSVEPARRGELLLFVGGDEETLARSRPTLELLGKAIFPLGAVGAGSRAKLICNMLLARYVEALGETLALSEAFRLDPQMVIAVLQASALASPMWGKAAALLSGQPPLHFSLRNMAKDLRLLDEEVDRAGLSLPAHEAVHAIFQEALTGGFGEGDYSTIANWVRRRT